MKKVLIQDRFASLEHVKKLRDLLDDRIDPKLVQTDFAFCLEEFKGDILNYNLILSHPHTDEHTDDGCCVPLIKTAHRHGIQVVLLYKTKYPHGEEIEAVAQNDNLEIIFRDSGNQWEVYSNAIKKYLLQK